MIQVPHIVEQLHTHLEECEATHVVEVVAPATGDVEVVVDVS